MVDFNKLKEGQLKLSKKLILKDSFGNLEFIGGSDASYSQNNIIAAIVVCDYKTMKIKEQVFAAAKAKFPYIPGFLAYREGHAISEAYAKLENKPDILIFDGNGILHPRKCGLASHMGILLDQASIGIAKRLLLGEVKNNKVYVDGKALGEQVVTRKHSKPLFISLGHKISLKTSVEIVNRCMRFPHKLPEPLHLAHRYSNEIREKVEKGEIKIINQINLF